VSEDSADMTTADAVITADAPSMGGRANTVQAAGRGVRTVSAYSTGPVVGSDTPAECPARSNPFAGHS
jgi:hypothetical protein